MNVKSDVVAALEALNAARSEFDDREREASVASNRKTDALNRLNAAQRAFDKTVAEVKASAPYDTDWRRALNASKA